MYILVLIVQLISQAGPQKQITKEIVKADQTRKKQMFEAKKTKIEEHKKIKKTLKKIEAKEESTKYMARIAGVNIPQNKIVQVGLTYIHGIGDRFSKQICKELDIPKAKRVNELTDDQILKIREYIDKNFTVEGDLRRELSLNIKRLIDLACYRGSRHRKKLPVRGQRTRCNARTRKGKAIAIAGKKLTPLKK